MSTEELNELLSSETETEVLEFKKAERQFDKDKLALNADLSLQEIILLDKVAKNKQLTDLEIKDLKSKKLIEGRKPNFYVSANIAKLTGEKEGYIKLKGFNEDYYIDLIIEYLRKFNEATGKDFNDLLFEKLPDILSDTQKKNKIRNLLQKLKRNEKIELRNSRKWKLV